MVANVQNLIHLTSDQAREYGSKGGKASAESKRRKRTMKQLVELFGSTKVTDEKTKQTLVELGIDPEEITYDLAVIAGQYSAAAKGNTNAATFIRDTKGERPHEVIETPDIDYRPLIDLTKRKKNGAPADGVRKV